MADILKLIEDEQNALRQLKDRGVSVDMTRGRPSKEQLSIAMPMLENAGCLKYDEEKFDARNYGEIAGTEKSRTLFASLMGVDKDEVIVGDGSSLDFMYTLVQFAMQFGILGSTPWNELEKVKFLCPAPGYDRHFAICEQFGIEMITIPLLDDGPDMDIVEKLVREDDSIKGIWCVPKYSNPTGIVYSKDTVERFAKLQPCAKDFRVFWDNAYIVHGLYDDEDNLENIFDVAKKYGNEDMFYEFVSTSKITFAGSGVSAMATSRANVKDIVKRMSYKIICPNKVNQVLHTEFLKDVDNVKEIMRRHASILRPKFELFDRKMREAFVDCDRVKWTRPNGGYFISLDVEWCAHRIVEIASEVGVKFTEAGATYPYRKDERDANVRIAPSVPTLQEMDYAVDVLIHAIKLALLEKKL